MPASTNYIAPEDCSRLVLSHPVLELEYSILCSQLKRAADESMQENYAELVAEALRLAQQLEHLYQYYLIVPREAAKLRRHQIIYKRWLFPDETHADNTSEPFSFTRKIRDAVSYFNWYRLLLTRSKRMLDLLNAMEAGIQPYRSFVLFMDNYTTAFFSYLAWCYFVPRFAVNIGLLAKHTIPGPWMQAEEASLAWYVRLYAQLQRRWFELANDSVWITAGLLTCFLLNGALAPIGFYVTLFAFAFDVVNASWRAYIELSRLYQLRDCYEQQGEGMEQRIAALDARLSFEKKRLALSIIIASVTFVTMCLLIPGLAINPIIPLLGAVLLVAILALVYVLNEKLEQCRPSDVIKEDSLLSKQSFFSPKSQPEENKCNYDWLFYDSQPII